MINAKARGVLDTQEADVTPLEVQVAFLRKKHLRDDLRVMSPRWHGWPPFPGLWWPWSVSWPTDSQKWLPLVPPFEAELPEVSGRVGRDPAAWLRERVCPRDCVTGLRTQEGTCQFTELH